ncbi:MAG TPA: four helix bundle protein [Candidatus Bipolaricaulis sp.]|nr:four helix bundle protein [Candidatus Bipolaricaulis sp.]
MAQIRRFEEIESWKKARELAKEIYVITGTDGFSRDFSLRDQMRRAAVSIVSNIAEGFARQTDREFVQFLYTARGSASEFQSQLYIASDLGYLGGEDFSRLYGMADEVSCLISGFIRYLKGERQ